MLYEDDIFSFPEENLPFPGYYAVPIATCSGSQNVPG